jgi:hypothetical protein
MFLLTQQRIFHFSGILEFYYSTAIEIIYSLTKTGFKIENITIVFENFFKKDGIIDENTPQYGYIFVSSAQFYCSIISL